MIVIDESFNKVIEALEKISGRYYFAGRLEEGLQVVQGGLTWRGVAEFTAALEGRLLVQQVRLMTANNFLGRGEFEETAEVLQAVTELAESHEIDALRAAGYQAVGWFRYCRTMREGSGEYADGLEPLQKALALWGKLDESLGVCEATFYSGLIYERLGELEEAKRLYTESERMAEQNQFQLAQSYALRHLAFVAYRQGETERVRPLLEQSLAIRRAIGFELFLPFSYTSLADFALMEGDVETAERLLGEAAEVTERLGYEMMTMFVNLSQARLSQSQNRLDMAREAFEKALHLAELVGHSAAFQQAEEGLQAVGER